MTRTIELVGDEYSNFLLANDGTIMVQVDGKFCPADASDAPRRAYSRLMPPRPALKRLLAKGNASGTQNYKGLVVLVEFNDKKFMRDDSPEIFSDMLNQRGYAGFYNRADPPALIEYTGSVRDYFVDNTMGAFDPTFDVVGPITIDFAQTYPNQTEHAREVITAAAEKAAQAVDLSNYDSDGDGEVELIYFIFAGGGSNQVGNDRQFIWPHAGRAYDLEFNGVKLGNYACSTELYGRESYQAIDGIGTICHEFSHVLGLPDLYDTDYSYSGGQSVHPGIWSVMAGGAYSNFGRTPSGYSAYERYAAGFASPKIIDRPGLYSIVPINSGNSFFRIDSSNEGEFFLIENRQTNRWDRELPGHGLIVWRVDSTDVDPWENDRINCNPERNYLEILRAMPKVSTSSGQIYDSAYDPYPGSGNVSEICLFDHDSQKAPVAIKNIEEERYTGLITFIATRDDLPALIEDFEDPQGDAGEGKYSGAFTNWQLIACSRAALPDAETGSGIRMMKNSEIISADIPDNVQGVSFDFNNPTSTAASVRCMYSTNKGLTWNVMQEFSNTDTPVASGNCHFTFVAPSLSGARYKIQQYSGSRTKYCYLDNIVMQTAPASTSGIGDIQGDARPTLSCISEYDYIEVRGAQSGGRVSAVYPDGRCAALSIADAQGVCRLYMSKGCGLVIIRHGNMAIKAVH
ncbi:MAG: M6 family metalloprotease domain-containing protein [Lachnospiraceae bacterium]|nr:M6 family metalloprotease domain-containing protein [Lachnospiraceae bacterium]